jgi:hypothetical protein
MSIQQIPRPAVPAITAENFDSLMLTEPSLGNSGSTFTVHKDFAILRPIANGGNGAEQKVALPPGALQEIIQSLNAGHLIDHMDHDQIDIRSGIIGAQRILGIWSNRMNEALTLTLRSGKQPIIDQFAIGNESKVLGEYLPVATKLRQLRQALFPHAPSTLPAPGGAHAITDSNVIERLELVRSSLLADSIGVQTGSIRWSVKEPTPQETCDNCYKATWYVAPLTDDEIAALTKHIANVTPDGQITEGPTSAAPTAYPYIRIVLRNADGSHRSVIIANHDNTCQSCQELIDAIVQLRAVKETAPGKKPTGTSVGF